MQACLRSLEVCLSSRRLLHVSCSVFAYGYDAMRVEMQGGDFQILLETGLLMLWQVLDWYRLCWYSCLQPSMGRAKWQQV